MKTALRSSVRIPFFGAALALACAASTLVSACSGDDTTPPAGGGPIPIESIRKEYETALCASLVRCGYMPDNATCVDLNAASQDQLQLLADVVYGTVTYDAAAARTCVNAISGLTCEGLSKGLQSVQSSCDSVFKGSVPEGGGCVVDDECLGDSRCDKEMCMGGGACCIGKCVPGTELVPLGGDCSMAACISDAYCDQGDGQGGAMPTCSARKDNGQTCNAVDACLAGQRCDTGGDGTCYKLSAEGQQCNPTISNGSCLSIDNWCDATAKKCVKLPGANEPCAQDGDKLRCLGYAYCDDEAMTCKARPVEGEDCVMNGPQCLGTLYCAHDDMTMKDTCKRPSPASVCVLDDETKTP